MAANVESMFYVREVPWHGLGTNVEEALTSREALRMSGLNWSVTQKSIYTDDGILISGFRANIRQKDKQVLGVVTDRYKVVQNTEAFAFTDNLLGEGVRYETAGSLQGGKKVWLLAKLPENYVVAGDQVTPYLVFSNSHDGSGAIKIAITPIRVVCQNTLNLALKSATRVWSTIHTGNIQNKLEEARKTILMADNYMSNLQKEVEELNKITLSDKKVYKLIDSLIPLSPNATPIQEKNVERQREDFKLRYFEAPDLIAVPKNGWRFINAVSDFATHSEPIRRTANFKENLFSRTMEGNTMIDKAFEMVKLVA